MATAPTYMRLWMYSIGPNMCTRMMERMPTPFMASNHTNRFCDDISYFVVFKTSFSIPPHNAAMSENEE